MTHDPAAMLLVEDDRNAVDVVLRALHRSGLDGVVHVARDGQEALEALGIESGSEHEQVRPSVVFLDIKMPRIDGWEVLRRIRANPELADLPVVICSASDHEADVRRSYEMGANSFLVKRFDPRSPGHYLAEAAHYWLEINQRPPRRRRPS